MESISNETSSPFINYINEDHLSYMVKYYIKLK